LISYTPGNIATITFQIVATASDTGYHTITLTATDDGAPAETTIVSLTVFIGLPVAMVSVTEPTCNGGCNGEAIVAASGGSGVYTYSWSTVPAQTSATATGLCAGIYTVLVSDGNGCSAIQYAAVNESSGIYVSLSANDIPCFGDSTIAAAIVSGGNPPYTYLWSTSPPQTTATATGLHGGSYSFQVTDSLGCITVDNININEPPALSLSTSATSPTCISCTDGIISLYPNGGTPGYTYTISPNAGTYVDTAYINLPADTYYVCVTDTNNCTVCDSVIVPPNSTGITSLSASAGVYFSPNPLNSGTTLNLNFEPKNAWLLVYDAIGKTEARIAINSMKTFLPGSFFPSKGVYFAYLRNDNGVIARAKLIVN
jgi:hypothetical protein